MPGTAPRPEYDPAARTLAARERAKAAELGVSVRTIQSRRARYARQGLWELVNQRAVRTWEATGRADARLVTAIREILDAETRASPGNGPGGTINHLGVEVSSTGDVSQAEARLAAAGVAGVLSSAMGGWCRVLAGCDGSGTGMSPASPAASWPGCRRPGGTGHGLPGSQR